MMEESTGRAPRGVSQVSRRVREQPRREREKEREKGREERGLDSLCSGIQNTHWDREDSYNSTDDSTFKVDVVRGPENEDGFGGGWYMLEGVCGSGTTVSVP